MRITVIGGSGHIGTYLVPRLVRAGHEVTHLSRGVRPPYSPAAEWNDVRDVTVDRDREDAEGTFGASVLATQPDVVVDMICFTVASATALVDALRGRVGHLLHCGSIWRYGPSHRLPIVEGAGTAPFDEYGIAKEEIARMLLAETAAGGLATTSIHPGHIVGPGWMPINPLGNVDPSAWMTLSSGRTLRVPGSGAESMHHVHADDVSQLFELAIEHRSAAAGHDFHAVAPTALTVRGYAEIASAWFGGHSPIETITWDQFREETTPEYANSSWGHLYRNHCMSIAKAERLLGYSPRFEPDEAILESIRWLITNDRLTVARPLVD